MMNNDEAIRYCAEEILGMWRDHGDWMKDGEKQFHVDNVDYDVSGYSEFNPLTNSNHLDMVRDKLVEMEGIERIDTHHSSGMYSVKVWSGSGIFHKDIIIDIVSDLRETTINLTRLTAYHEAWKKLSEAQK